MNKIILNLILGFTFLNVYSQSTQSFTRDFRTSSGIYGYVEILTQPTGFGTLAIQQKQTVVQGINNFNGNSLSEYGINFPFNCSNCFFYADGSVSMQIRDVIGRSSGSFSKGGTINLNSGLNRTVNWYTGVAEKHNEIRRKYNDDNYWELTGRVESLNIYSVKGADFGKVTRAVDNYNKAKQKTDKFNSLISQASNTSLSKNQRLSYLNQAKQYAQTSTEQNQVNSAIKSLNQEIESEQNQNTTTSNNTTSQNIGNISSVSSNTGTTSNQNQVYFDAKSNMYTTPEIEAIKARSQAKYERNMQKVQVISNAVTGLVNYFEQQRQQRLAYEERQRQLKEQEERKKELFQNQAYQYRKEYKKIINARKSFLNQVKLKSTLDEDGTGFKPLYIYYAYVAKDYDYYYENVSYPSTLDFKINQNIDVKFSPVFGFFPYSNGQYPFIEDIKSKILYEYFDDISKDYEVVFFQWENSVENIVTTLKGNLNKAVNDSYFANAIASNNNEIIFLNSKINASQSKDYWTGKKVKTKNTKKVDYFSENSPKTKSKKDYWNMPKKKKTVKDSTNSKKKKVNYWDN